jgi:hypothetical protein
VATLMTGGCGSTPKSVRRRVPAHRHEPAAEASPPGSGQPVLHSGESVHALLEDLRTSVAAWRLRPVPDPVEEFLNAYPHGERYEEDKRHYPEIAASSLKSEGTSGDRDCTNKPGQSQDSPACGKYALADPAPHARDGTPG